jgi:Zn-dependent peptidase ImmA (M78 family)
MYDRTTPDPWHFLHDRFPNVKVYIRAMADRWGQTVWQDDGTARIEIAHDLGPIEQRCCLAHEIQHLIAGRPCTDLCSRNERSVIEATARWLLPAIAAIGSVLSDLDIASAALHLGVTLSILNDRLHTLTPDEEQALAEYLPRNEEPAGAMAAYHDTRRDTHCTDTECPCTP